MLDSIQYFGDVRYVNFDLLWDNISSMFFTHFQTFAHDVKIVKNNSDDLINMVFLDASEINAQECFTL